MLYRCGTKQSRQLLGSASELRVKTYECLGDRDQTQHIDFVLAQIEHLQRPISFQDLRDVGNSALGPRNRRSDRWRACDRIESMGRTRKSLPLTSSVNKLPTLGRSAICFRSRNLNSSAFQASRSACASRFVGLSTESCRSLFDNEVESASSVGTSETACARLNPWRIETLLVFSNDREGARFGDVERGE